MNDIQNNFCRNLRKLRRKFGLNEWQLARYLKLSREAIETLESGEWSPEVDRGTLILIHGYYGITPRQMLSDGDL